MKYKEIMNYFDSPAAPVCYVFVDRVASFFVWINVNLFRIHPNFISLFSGIFAILTIFNFGTGNFIKGAIFYFLSFLLDAIDGPSARAMNKTSMLGVILEVWTDSIRLVGSTLSIIWYIYQNTLDEKWLILSFIWLVSFSAGLWLYPKTKESFKNFQENKNVKGYYISPVPTWMDYEMIAFFFLPLFGKVKIGLFILTIGYLISSLGMSVYLLLNMEGKGNEQKVNIKCNNRSSSEFRNHNCNSVC